MALLDAERPAVVIERPLARPSIASESAHLPVPPSDVDLYSFFGRQHSWLLILRALAAALVAVNLWLFAFGHAALVPFAIVAVAVAVTNVVNGWTSTRRRTLDADSHAALVANWSPVRIPSIDVFLPTAGEPLDLLDNTYRHVAAMEYRGEVRVYVLDDAGRPEVAALTDIYGFDYIHRPNAGELKKAGNLRHAFDRTSGDLIVIFDADFVPRTDFLAHVAPYFEDETVGVLQTPQFFDSDRRLGWLQSGAGATQELFYRWIQPSRDAQGVPICCGTNAVYRRSSLERIGGIPKIDHSEDIYTGFELMKIGQRTRYIPVVLAKGLSPDTFAAFVAQQYRWCMGSMCLLLDRTFHRAPMTLGQRLCFYSGLGYYLTTAGFVFLMPLPTLVMVWLLPDFISPVHYLWLVPALLTYPLTAWMHRSHWGLNVLRVQLLYCFAHALAIVHAFTRREAEWVPTGSRSQGRTVATTIAGLAFGWLALSQVALVIGLIVALMRGTSPVALSATFVLTAGGLLVSLPVLRSAMLPRRTPRMDEAASTTSDAAASVPLASVLDLPTVRLRAVPAAPGTSSSRKTHR